MIEGSRRQWFLQFYKQNFHFLNMLSPWSPTSKKLPSWRGSSGATPCASISIQPVPLLLSHFPCSRFRRSWWKRRNLSRCPCTNLACDVLKLLQQQTVWPGECRVVGLCSAVSTWRGQNPSGGAGALPNIAVVHAETLCSCQKLSLVSVQVLLLYWQLRNIFITLK